VDFVEASFFDEMPSGADVYVLSRVLHNWPDEDAARPLRGIRAGIATDGRVIVVEELIQPASGPPPGPDEAGHAAPDGPPRRAPDGAGFMDLLILLTLTGCDRTGHEYAGLLSQAGFGVTEVHPPPPGRSVESAIEARPA